MTSLSRCTAQKMKFFIKDFFSECDQILNGKIFIFCAEYFTQSHNKMRLNKIFQT